MSLSALPRPTITVTNATNSKFDTFQTSQDLSETKLDQSRTKTYIKHIIDLTRRKDVGLLVSGSQTRSGRFRSGKTEGPIRQIIEKNKQLQEDPTLAKHKRTFVSFA
jgi:hypothetical protein